MRKALPFALAVSIAVLGAGNLFAQTDIPVLMFGPDIELTASNPELGQTADNYYIYQGLNFADLVSDEDSTTETEPILGIGFSAGNGARNLSIGGISRLTPEQEAAFEMDGAIPAHKSIIQKTAYPVVRAVSDLFTGAGPDVPEIYLGEKPYGFPSVSKQMISLMAGDGITSAMVANVWIKTSTANRPSEIFNGPLVEAYEPDNLVKAMGGVDFNPAVGDFQGFWEGLNTTEDPVVRFPDNDFANITRSGTGLDSLGMDSTPVDNPTAVMFGAWSNYMIQFGEAWPDNALFRVTWTVSSDAEDAGMIPGIRSRISPGFYQQEDGTWDVTLSARGINSELRYDPSATYANTALMANNNQVNLRHYYYGGNYAELTTGVVAVHLDYIDLPDAYNIASYNNAGQPVMGRVTGARINIDRLIVEIVPRPQDGNADHLVSLFKASGQALADAGDWIGFSAPFDIQDRMQGSGTILTYANANGINLIADSAPSGYTAEARIFGTIFSSNLGPTLADTAGGLVRARAKIRTNAGAVNLNKGYVRFRLSPQYGEVSSMIVIVSYPDPNLEPSFAVPTAAGSYYETYLETPVINVPGAPEEGWGWTVAMDAYTPYHPDNPLWNNADFPKLAIDFTMTELEISQVIKY